MTTADNDPCDDADDERDPAITIDWSWVIAETRPSISDEADRARWDDA
jgi:hypothetical protein